MKVEVGIPETKNIIRHPGWLPLYWVKGEHLKVFVAQNYSKSLGLPLPLSLFVFI